MDANWIPSMKVPTSVCAVAVTEDNDQKIFEGADEPSWWSIAGSDILDALRRAHAGEDPDLVFAEMYANSEIHNVDEEDEDD
jgi:hypothetical protein